jgi:SAM-dependent methyltransferase
MVHLDLFESRISHCADYLVGNIEKIPAANELFDIVLCVGSVLNYADPFLALNEFARVLRPGGLLIVEYERSGSFEYRFKDNFSRNCCRIETFYGNAATHLWVYSDEFFDGILSSANFSLRAERRFHALSSVALAITNSSAKASLFTFADGWLAQIWPFRNIASNRMLVVEKLPAQ